MLSATHISQLNAGDAAGSIVALGDALDRGMNVLKATYDFTRSGGAIGDLTLQGRDGNPAVIPSGAIILHAIVHVAVAAVGATATLAFKAQAAGDLLAATAVASFSLAAVIDGLPDFTATPSIVTTAARTVTLTIGTAALTAGKINVYISYVS